MKKLILFTIALAILVSVCPVQGQIKHWDGGRVARFTTSDSTLMKRFYFLAPEGVATDTVLLNFSQYSEDGNATVKIWTHPFMLRPGSKSLNSSTVRMTGGADSLTLTTSANTTESVMLQFRVHCNALDSLENDSGGAITTVYRPDGYVVDVVGQSGNRADNEIWLQMLSYKTKFLKDL